MSRHSNASDDFQSPKRINQDPDYPLNATHPLPSQITLYNELNMVDCREILGNILQSRPETSTPSLQEYNNIESTLVSLKEKILKWRVYPNIVKIDFDKSLRFNGARNLDQEYMRHLIIWVNIPSFPNLSERVNALVWIPKVPAGKYCEVVWEWPVLVCQNCSAAGFASVVEKTRHTLNLQKITGELVAAVNGVKEERQKSALNFRTLIILDGIRVASKTEEVPRVMERLQRSATLYATKAPGIYRHTASIEGGRIGSHENAKVKQVS